MASLSSQSDGVGQFDRIRTQRQQKAPIVLLNVDTRLIIADIRLVPHEARRLSAMPIRMKYG